MTQKHLNSKSTEQIEQHHYLKSVTILQKLLFHEQSSKEISIPSKVSKIGQYAFYNCKYLAKVEILTNSNLQTIEKWAFSSSNVKDFFIPSKVSHICMDVFAYCHDLQIIEISEESKLVSFPLLAFRSCAEIVIMIPSSNKKLIHIFEPI